MLKKLLAGLTAIALSLGMVALTAAPASAHHNTINAVVACNTTPDGFWKVTWTVQNSEGIDEKITASNDTSIVPIDTVIAGGQALTVVTYFSSKPTSNFTLRLSAKWTNNQTNTSEGTLYKNDFKDNCVPDDTSKKIEICHATSSATNPYTRPTVAVDSIITNDPNGHGTHADDIIPPFTYVKQGQPGSYPGKNWTTYGQAVYNAGCDYPTQTPAAPTFTDAQCTAPGQLGQASYVIPTTTGVTYQVRIGGTGNYATVAAGTYYVAGGTQVEVTAIANSGYKITGTTSWSKTFPNPDCIVNTTPAAATFSVNVCTAPGQMSQGTYTIPTTAGVDYQVQLNGAGGYATTAAGTYNVPQGTLVEVRAIAQAGYTLQGTTTWSQSYPRLNCIVDQTPAAPTFSAAVCNAQPAGTYGDASYVIPTTTGVSYQVRVRVGSGAWSAWTTTAAGTYTVPANARVQVRAVADDGYTLQGTTSWDQRFTAPDCLTDVVATKPTKTEAVCTGEEQVGSASYLIPTIEGVKYQILTSGGWVDLAPGSHDAADGSLVTLRAVPLPGYELTNADLLSSNKVFLLLFDNLNAGKDCIVPQAPTSTPQVCTEPGTTSQATYTIPADTGVRYQVKNGDTWEDIAAGTYDVDAFPTTVEVRAVPTRGHHFLDGATTSWTFEFASAGDCIQNVEVAPATKVDQTCVVDLETLGGSYVSGWITIPSTTGVDYYIDGDLYGAGEWEFAPGTYVVTAVAQSGYGLTGEAGPWELTIAKAPPCGDLTTNPSIVPLVTFVQTTCTASGSYTLAVDPAEESAGVIWTVSGGNSAALGKHSVTTAGTVTITATPAPGYGFGDGLPGNVREWSFTFSSLPDDCLPTLAFTGGSGIPAGALGIATLVTLGGVLLVMARRREELGAE